MFIRQMALLSAVVVGVVTACALPVGQAPEHAGQSTQQVVSAATSGAAPVVDVAQFRQEMADVRVMGWRVSCPADYGTAALGGLVHRVTSPVEYCQSKNKMAGVDPREVIVTAHQETVSVTGLSQIRDLLREKHGETFAEGGADWRVQIIEDAANRVRLPSGTVLSVHDQEFTYAVTAHEVEPVCPSLAVQQRLIQDATRLTGVSGWRTTTEGTGECVAVETTVFDKTIRLIHYRAGDSVHARTLTGDSMQTFKVLRASINEASPTCRSARQLRNHLAKARTRRGIRADVPIEVVRHDIRCARAYLTGSAQDVIVIFGR